MNRLVLASQSPRRQELLALLRVPFETQPANIDETPKSQEAPIEYVERLALEKAACVFDQQKNISATWVIGSDTTVVCDEQLLGKPESKSDFVRMMRLLSGRAHQVMTAVAVSGPQGHIVESVISTVTFTELSEKQIERYWQSGEPTDKAGGYGIQGLGGVFVTHISGDYNAIVGLPLNLTARLLSQANYPMSF